ncbi:MAG: EamA family transporter [Actinobacteria bacterium]|nr:EamA family transporter [Actinomycetota bacterium]
MTTLLRSTPGGAGPVTARAPRPVALALALGTVYVVWGSTYLAIKVGIETIPSLLLAAVRFLVAGVALYAVATRVGDRVGDRPTRAHWREAFVLGAAMLLAGNGFVTVAEERLDSGIAALLVAMVPLWMAVLDRALFGARLSRLAVVGLALGFVGVAVLIDPFGGGQGPAGIHVPSALMILAGSASWAYGSLRARESVMPTRPLVSTAMQMIAAGSMFVVLSVLRGELRGFAWSEVSAASAGALLYLIVAGSLVAFSAYVWLIKNAPAPIVATYAYVNPVIAVGLGALVLDEAVGLRNVVAGAIIVAGVALIIRARARTGSGAAVLRRLRQSAP